MKIKNHSNKSHVETSLSSCDVQRIHCRDSGLCSVDNYEPPLNKIEYEDSSIRDEYGSLTIQKSYFIGMLTSFMFNASCKTNVTGVKQCN